MFLLSFHRQKHPPKFEQNEKMEAPQIDFPKGCLISAGIIMLIGMAASVWVLVKLIIWVYVHVHIS